MKCAETALHRLLVSVRTQKHLLDIPDRVLRRLELLFPANVEEQQAALYWMGEQGDEDDAALLTFIPAANILCSPSLYESTQEKLLDRIGPAKPEVQEANLGEYLVRVAAEILPQIRDGLRGMLDTSQVGRSQWLDSDTTPLTALQQEAEVASRELQYLFPASVQDYEATLRWFKESGRGTELGLLFAVPPPGGTSDEIKWLHQAAQDDIIDRLIESEAPSADQDSAFRNLVLFGIALRPILGPRGSVTIGADRRISAHSATHILEAMALPDIDRNNLVMVLGEWGGKEDAEALGARLSEMLPTDEVENDYQIYLASALSNLGGPDAVEGLLRAAEAGSERVRMVALSGLGSLATAGAVALTEYSEPVTIVSEEMREAYMEIAKRLAALTSAPTTPAHVRHKADELLETLQLSLNSAPVSA
ncbi:MAG: hypothetical protein WAQ99_22390 [Pyrinomonadaceae bacterium]